MNVERVYAAPTLDGSEGLLATVVTYRPDRPAGVAFATEPGDQTQVGYLKHPAGHGVPAHRHPPARRVTERTEEVLVVLRGRVRLDLYSSDGVYQAARTLGPGDCAVLHAGGHAVTCESDSEVVEVKTGPYHGRDGDKVALDVTRPC